jgi:hypothetical protein
VGASGRDSSLFSCDTELLIVACCADLRRVMSGFSDVVVPPPGVVRLEDKARPVCEGEPSAFHPHYAYTRSVVDVSRLKEKLTTMPQELWDDERQDGNVRMTRPAHDAWGIKKIVFQFSDDFLLKTLDFPWSQQAEWRELLLPIYESIGVSESRVVRSLLASIPPGVSIPIHHDTGYWVKHTHRYYYTYIHLHTHTHTHTIHHDTGYWVKHTHRSHIALHHIIHMIHMIHIITLCTHTGTTLPYCTLLIHTTNTHY